ncbi:MAG: adenylate/guanylate cyclase domain-containing protein [Chloroflexi bacterium]|nr:adenylate/guanylate cyclase domain-containing protein [Chloroflexota bacterium]
MQTPEVHYARSGEVAVAYQVVGAGATDIVFARHLAGDLLSTWQQPLLVRHVEGLAANGRLILLDRRGTGLSDRVREVQSLETMMDDIRAVMDDAGSERAVLWTGLSSTGIGMLFAATYPDRCAGLMLLDPQVRGTASEDYPWAPSAEEWRDRLRDMRAGWGERSYLEKMAREWTPEMADDPDFIDWLVWHMRRSLSPGAALTAYRMAMEADVTDVLAAVRVPTLILARPRFRERAAWAAKHIREAKLVELPAWDGIFTWTRDDVHDATMEATSRFVASLAAGARHQRVLTTILFTDLVASTELAAQLGDGQWRALLGRHHGLVRRELARYDGVELDTAGDGFFATFDGPARAVQAARAIRDAVHKLGMEVRAGVHTGECELLDGKVAGIAVSIGARIAGLAAPGEVLVSSTVKDLVAGSGLEFEDRGAHELKGVPGRWSLFAAQ